METTYHTYFLEQSLIQIQALCYCVGLTGGDGERILYEEAV
jgi:hypothetical protein